MAETYLTVNGMLRWLERAEQRDVDAVRRGLAAADECAPSEVEDLEVVAWTLAESRRTMTDLEAEVVTPLVARAIEMGVRSVISPCGCKLLIENKRIVTVLPPERRGKAKILSARERRRGGQRLSRRRPGA